MIIKQLNLNNFGVYFGYHEIDLEPQSPERPIVLFGGLNGGGKTTLLEALLLGLYGKLADTPRRKGKAYTDYLEALINKQATKTEGASAEIVFYDSETEAEYRVFRQWAKRGQNVRESLQVFVDGRLDMELAESWDEEVDRFLPQKLCNLFFFDGEQIEALADPEKSKEILNTAISGLLGISLVDQACADLSILQRKIADRSTVSVDGVVIETKEQHQCMGEKIARRYSELDAMNSELAEVIRLLGQVEREFQRGGGGLFEQLSELEKSVREVRAEKATVEAELRSAAASALPLQMLSGILCDILETARDEEDASFANDKRKAVEEIRTKLLDELIGKRVSKSACQITDKWFDQELNSLAISETALWMDNQSGFPDRLDSLIQIELRSSVELARQLAAKERKLSERLTRLERKIEIAPEEESIEELLNRRAAFTSRAAELKLTIEQTKRELERFEMERAALAAKVKKLQAEQIESTVELRAIDVADEVAEGLQRFKERVVRKHLARIEGLIVDSYAQLLRKKSLVSRVEIDPITLALQLFDYHGSPLRPESLSAGERQLLATSILWALAKSSGRALPVVIDTPLGRLDSTHREKLVENYFPNASMQVVLLSTDEEISADYLHSLEPYISRKYTITFDDEAGGSAIQPGYSFGEVA